MASKYFFLAGIFIMAGCAETAAADLTLSKIRFGDHGERTRVTLEFDGTERPKGRVSVVDNNTIVELEGVRPAKQVDVTGKPPLVASYDLRKNADGAPVLVVTTRDPIKLVAPPTVLMDKKNSPRLYFDLERNTAAAAKPPKSAGEPQVPAPPPTPELEAAAKGGDIQAQMVLAGLLAKQAKPDFAGALQWYMAAAEKGNGPAAYNVAQYTRLGQGVPANPSAAFQWYERAASANFPPAQVALAILLIEGQVVPADPERARFLLQQAASAGDLKAKNILEKLDQQ